MTTHHDLLGQLRREWQHLGHSPASRRSLARLREHHPGAGLDHLTDLGDVVDALEARGHRTVLERAELVRVLLVDADDPLVHRALLQTLLPGIVSVCRQLRFGEGVIADPSETLSAAVALASELLSDWAGQSRQYCAPDLLSALRGRLRRWLLREKDALRQVSAYAPGEDEAPSASPLLARLDSLRGGPHDRLVRLTYERVFEGRSLRELAQRDHSAPRALQSELQHFAIRHLI